MVTEPHSVFWGSKREGGEIGSQTAAFCPDEHGGEKRGRVGLEWLALLRLRSQKGLSPIPRSSLAFKRHVVTAEGDTAQQEQLKILEEDAEERQEERSRLSPIGASDQTEVESLLPLPPPPLLFSSRALARKAEREKLGGGGGGGGRRLLRIKKGGKRRRLFLLPFFSRPKTQVELPRERKEKKKKGLVIY